MTARHPIAAREGDPKDNSALLHDLRAELRHTCEMLVSGRVMDRSRLAVRARELDQAIRRIAEGTR